MALFLVVPALIFLCAVLFAPLMLPGAVLALILFGVAELIRRHHAAHVLHPR